ncbi:MFS transporter [Amphibacillus jilinensis]|uniref:MFS transporter n=1 Tax=Amphibacillus jilinensis TaxID=1216008 RepID=UPI0002FCAA21|nr:MFS transporter [Amphibacillus jilinensis]
MTQNLLRKDKTIWNNSIFIKLFASYSISMFGHWFDRVAQVVLFGYVWKSTPMVIALIPVAYALPQVILGQFVGGIIERNHKVKIMLFADLLSAGLTLILFFTNTALMALIIISLRAAVNVVHNPAQQGLIKLIVNENLIIKAVTLNGTVNQLSKFIGPFIGAGLIGLTSPKLCILINAIAFIVSALFLLLILLNKDMIEQTKSTKTDQPSKGPFWNDWLQSWKIVLHSKIVFISLLATFIGQSIIQMVDIQFPILFRNLAPTLPELTGWLMGASGLGALVMIISLNQMRELRKFGYLMGTSMLLIGVGFGGIGFLREGFTILLPIILCFIAGLGVGLLTITFQYIIQTEPKEYEVGRVSAISNSVMNISVLTSPIIGGLLIPYLGISLIYIISGLTLAIFGMSLMLGSSLLFKEDVKEDGKEIVAE